MILLINPKTTKSSELHTEFFREPNSGILYLAAVLDNENIPVDILDLEQYADLSFNEQLDIIRNVIDIYQIFGITCLTNTFHLAVKIAKAIKSMNSDKFIVFGGPHASFQFNEILQEYQEIDFICVGEAEDSFLQLSNHLLNENNLYPHFRELEIEKKLNNIKGLAFLNSKHEILFTGFPDPIEINSLPLPARYKLPQDLHYYKVANIVINRGCPNQCSFCSRQELFKTTRIRNIDSILAEIKDIMILQNYEYINFYDNININRKFFKQFCKMFIDNNIDIPWGCELRVDTITDTEASLLKSAGCKLVATGIESSSLEVLKKNFKYQDPAAVVQGIRNLKKYEIPIQAYFVLGLPGETEETVSNTINYIQNLPLGGDDTIDYFSATPYPGSRLWDMRNGKDINIIESDFSKFDCQHVIFETEQLKYFKLKQLFKDVKNIEKDFIKRVYQ